MNSMERARGVENPSLERRPAGRKCLRRLAFIFVREDAFLARGFQPLALLVTFLISGCGNQMYRQPSYTPLDTPRAAPPTESVPVAVADAPTDARAVASSAYGANQTAKVVRYAASFSTKEPDLPPPNLSDNARYEPAPAAVNALKSPLPNDPRLVSAGHTLFQNRCIQCHNAGGYGYGKVGQYLVPHPPDLAAPLVQNIANGAMFWHITMGQGKMPGFRHWLTPIDRWTLVQYVRSLKGALEGQKSNDTRGTPYPVYGLTGYEDGKSAYPFKALNPPTSDSGSKRRTINQGFGQPPR